MGLRYHNHVPIMNGFTAPRYAVLARYMLLSFIQGPVRGGRGVSNFSRRGHRSPISMASRYNHCKIMSENSVKYECHV